MIFHARMRVWELAPGARKRLTAPERMDVSGLLMPFLVDGPARGMWTREEKIFSSGRVSKKSQSPLAVFQSGMGWLLWSADEAALHA